jgi:hypothetical protein
MCHSGATIHYVTLTLYVLDNGKLVHIQWCQSQVAKVTEWLRSLTSDHKRITIDLNSHTDNHLKCKGQAIRKSFGEINAKWLFRITKIG